MAFASETSPARSSGIENDIESQRVEQAVMRSMSAVGPCLFSEGLQTVIGWGGLFFPQTERPGRFSTSRKTLYGFPENHRLYKPN